MSDEQKTGPAPDEQPTGHRDQDNRQSDKPSTGRDDLVETVLGLAVLGVGAALLSGGMSLGGVLRGLTRGAPPRTPPIGPM